MLVQHHSHNVTLSEIHNNINKTQKTLKNNRLTDPIEHNKNNTTITTTKLPNQQFNTPSSNKKSIKTRIMKMARFRQSLGLGHGLDPLE